MNTVTVVIFSVGGILIYTAVKGDGAGGYNPVVLIRAVLSGKYKGSVPSKSDLDKPQTQQNSFTPTGKYYNPSVPI